MRNKERKKTPSRLSRFVDLVLLYMLWYVGVWEKTKVKTVFFYSKSDGKAYKDL